MSNQVPPLTTYPQSATSGHFTFQFRQSSFQLRTNLFPAFQIGQINECFQCPWRTHTHPQNHCATPIYPFQFRNLARDQARQCQTKSFCLFLPAELSNRGLFKGDFGAFYSYLPSYPIEKWEFWTKSRLGWPYQVFRWIYGNFQINWARFSRQLAQQVLSKVSLDLNQNYLVITHLFLGFIFAMDSSITRSIANYSRLEQLRICLVLNLSY